MRRGSTRGGASAGYGRVAVCGGVEPPDDHSDEKVRDLYQELAYFRPLMFDVVINLTATDLKV